MKKGFTLVTLIIMIIIIFLIGSLVVMKNIRIPDEGHAIIILNEMKLLQAKLYEYQLNHEEDPEKYPYVGKELTLKNYVQLGDVVYGIGSNEGYYELNNDDIKSIVGVANISNIYLINYETQDVVYKRGCIIKNKVLYSIDEISSQVNPL